MIFDNHRYFFCFRNFAWLRDKEKRNKTSRGTWGSCYCWWDQAGAETHILCTITLWSITIVWMIFEHHKDIFPSPISSWSETKTTITAILVKYLAKESNKTFICTQQGTCVALKQLLHQISVPLPDSFYQFINRKRQNDQLEFSSTEQACNPMTLDSSFFK